MSAIVEIKQPLKRLEEVLNTVYKVNQRIDTVAVIFLQDVMERVRTISLLPSWKIWGFSMKGLKPTWDWEALQIQYQKQKKKILYNDKHTPSLRES